MHDGTSELWISDFAFSASRRFLAGLIDDLKTLVLTKSRPLNQLLARRASPFSGS